MNDLTRSFCLPLMLLLSGAPALAAQTQDYDSLILRARKGDYQPALQMLQEREQQGQTDKRTVYDHITIASWAGQPGEVLDLYRKFALNPETLPAPVLSAVARAYRDSKNWADALALYRTGQRRFLGNPAFALEEAMTLADSGSLDQAEQRAKALAAGMPANAEAQSTLSYVYRVRREPYAALQHADAAYRLDPGNISVVREYILALQQGGLALAALQTAQSHPKAASPALMRELQGDYAAELSNLASMPSRSREERFRAADAAIARYDAELAAWEPLGEPARRDVIRARIDRIQALHARVRMHDVVDEYERLVADGVTPPDYILDEVASAYLYTQQPDKAQELYRRFLASRTEAPTPLEKANDQISLYYALVEGGNFDAAQTLIDKAQADQAVWINIKGVPNRSPNDARLALAQTAAAGKEYANDPEAAERQLSAMVAAAPRDLGQRIALAQIHRDRHQPRLAETELKMAETLQPESKDLIAAQGETALALREWRQAEILKNYVIDNYPESLAAQRLARDWEVHQKSELRVTSYLDSSSNSPVSGKGDFGFDSVLYSPPLDRNWRGFAGGGYAWGDFEEGHSTYRWARGGAEWRGRDLTAEVEASANNYGYGVKTGASASIVYDLDDQWQFGATAAFRSRATPLRALAHGIYANTLTAFAHWQPNERREWSVSLSPSRFSDGNNRMEVQVSGRERLYSSPKVVVDLQLDLGASRNSREDAPYFNPRSDLTAVPTLNITHTLYRHYDTSLEQIFTLGAGAYSQQGYGTGAIGVLGYGLRYRFNKTVDVGVSITGVSRPYDGVRERDVNVMATLNLRF